MKTIEAPALPNRTQMNLAAHRMISNGGNFEYHMGQAYIYADERNREAIARAFSSTFIPFIPQD